MYKHFKIMKLRHDIKNLKKTVRKLKTAASQTRALVIKHKKSMQQKIRYVNLLWKERMELIAPPTLNLCETAEVETAEDIEARHKAAAAYLTELWGGEPDASTIEASSEPDNEYELDEEVLRQAVIAERVS